MKWFQRCAFCSPPPDLVHEFRFHHPWCFWMDFLKAAERAPNGVALIPWPHAIMTSWPFTSAAKEPDHG